MLLGINSFSLLAELPRHLLVFLEHFVFPYYMIDLYVSVYLMLILEAKGLHWCPECVLEPKSGSWAGKK